MADHNPTAGNWILRSSIFWYEKCGGHLITPTACGQKEVSSKANKVAVRKRRRNPRLASVVSGRRSDLKTMPIPDSTFAGVIGHLEILGQFETIGGASVFTQAAEHAARSVVSERGENFAASGIVAKPADDDEVFRARESAEVAGNTQRFASLWIHIQARRASVTFGDHGTLERILLGVNILGRLITKRQPHPLEQIHKEEAAQEVFHRFVV